MREKATPERSRLLPTTVMLLAILSASLLAACGNNRSFESEQWLNGDARTRGRMSEDLVKRKILIGQTADEAQRLLGQPDKNYTNVLSYHIDMGWAFKNPDSYGLQVHLDDNRRIREVKIVD
jgi:hypothetical protein